MPEDITTGELGRRLDFIERMIDRRFNEVNDSIKDMQYLHRDVYISDMGAAQARINALEEYVKENESAKKKVYGWIVTGMILPILVVIILQWLQLS